MSMDLLTHRRQAFSLHGPPTHEQLFFAGLKALINLVSQRVSL